MKWMRFLVRNGQRRKPHEPSIAQRVRREQLAPYSKPQVLFGGLHHQRSDPAAAGFRCDGNGQDAAHVALEKEHHRRGHRFPTVFHKRQGSFVAQDPVDMIPTESVLTEAENLEPVQRVEVIRPGNAKQGAVEPRVCLFSFSTAKG